MKLNSLPRKINPISERLTPSRITVIYIFLGSLWILISDKIVITTSINFEHLSMLNTFKGLVYVFLSGAFFYYLIRRSMTTIRNTEKSLRESLEELEVAHEELIAAEETLKQQFDELRESEDHFRRIYEGVSAGVLIQTPDGKIGHANSAACNILGLSLPELRGKAPMPSNWLSYYNDGTPFRLEDLPSALLKTSLSTLKNEIIIHIPNKGKRWLVIHSDSIDAMTSISSVEVITTLIDNTPFKYMEVYEQLLRDIDHRVLTDQPLKEIFQYLCRKLISDLDYYSAWIWLKNPDGSTTCYASAGAGSEFIDRLNLRWDETPEGQGAVGEAIRTGHIQVQSLQNNPAYNPWRPIIDSFHLHTGIALPLTYKGETFGALSLYSSLPDFFNEKHINELERFSFQTAIALAAAKHKEQQERYRLLSEYTRDMIIFMNEKGQILEANLAALNEYGYTKDEFLNLTAVDLYAPDSIHSKLVPATIPSGLTFESTHQKKDGTSFPVEISSQTALLNSQPVILNVIRNITERRESEESIKNNELRYREMFENMSNAAVVYEAVNNGTDFVIKEFNNAAEKIENISRGYVIDRTVSDVFSEIIEFSILDILQRVWLTGNPEHYPLTLFKNGSIAGWRTYYIYKLPTGEIVAIYEDITSRKQAEEAVWQEKERAEVTLHSIGDGVITTDIAGTVNYINPVAEKLTGWSRKEAEGLPLMTVFNIVNEYTDKPAVNPVEKCFKNGTIVELANHTILINRNEQRIAIEDSAAPIRNRQGGIIGAVLTFHDVSEKRSLLSKLDYQAHHDSLTGLPNRLLFNDRLNSSLNLARKNNLQMAVLFLDMDRFKLINDTLGHNVGDKLLQSAAKRLKSCLRKEDTIARQGGDEFILLLSELENIEDAATVAQKILSKFSQPFNINKQEIFISTSIGISIYPLDGESGESLVKHADMAMYFAKEKGRNNYQFFDAELNNIAKDRLDLENYLRKAMEKEEFIVYYQPQVDVTKDKIIGMEALVRWQHPEKGLISPAQFIPIAEETGLIIPLGEWVLKTACVQSKLLQEKGYPMNISVNLSARQFRQPNLLSSIADILNETQLDSHRLELEITESIAMEDVDFTITILQELKKMGVRLSIDDFGTGFSCLNYLKRFPIDTLKIDKSFIGDIGSNRYGGEIVSAILVLAQNLNLKVIAEGVETQEQLSFLKERKCNEIQGYLFSKPIPAAELEFLLSKQVIKSI